MGAPYSTQTTVPFSRIKRTTPTVRINFNPPDPAVQRTLFHRSIPIGKIKRLYKNIRNKFVKLTEIQTVLTKGHFTVKVTVF